ncbi:hypothetical protein VTJ83DRAFT_1611 [Remersonia thermophila]|uniref:JmjC domain-containing protein n=1 Tax=Remersonia thermophila TaxID=72144 RepID=A0ABR4DGP6_9PEZI
MDVLQPKVDSIGGEVSEISDALRAYLEHGLVSGRRVQPPKTKAGRDLLQHLLGRLDQVSSTLNDIKRLTTAAPPSTSPSPMRAGPSIPRPLSTAAPTAPPSQPSSAPAMNAMGFAEGSERAQSGVRCHSGALAERTSSRSGHDGVAPLPPRFPAVPAAPWAAAHPGSHIILSDGSAYAPPIPVEKASPLFDCTYQDIHILNEELFELYSSHPVVRELGYIKLQVRNLPPLNVSNVDRPTRDHATSFCYRVDPAGLVKVDTGKRCKFSPPRLPLPVSAKTRWSLDEQRHLWNSSAADPPKGNRPYIIGNPLFDDVELSPGEKLRRRGRTVLEGINTQYVYFNLAGKTLTTMHREDAHVRSENLLRSGQHKFWCFVKPAFSKKLEERMAREYPEMRRCSQAVRHLSRHIPPAKLDEWGIGYTLDYCVPGQAVVTEPGTYHQVLNLGPNYAIAINLEYESSPDMPPDYRFCDKNCPDKFAMSADDFRIYETPPPQPMPRTPDTSGGRRAPAPAAQDAPKLPHEPARSGSPSPEDAASAAPRLQLTPASSRGQEQGSPRSPPALQGASSSSQAAPSEASQPSPCSGPRDVSIPRGLPAKGISGPDLPAKIESTSPRLAPTGTASGPAADASQGSLTTVPPAGTPRPPLTGDDAASDPFAVLQRAAAQAALPHPPAPLRKTARMINPEREEDRMPDPRPSKRPKPERPVAPELDGAPVAAASPVAASPYAAGASVPSGASAPVPFPRPAPGPQAAASANAPLARLSTLFQSRGASKLGTLAAAKIRGKPAFERLAHLVREWRRYARAAAIAVGGFGLVRALTETEKDHPELHLFLLRLFKMELSKCIEAATARSGSLASQNFKGTMLQSLGWAEAGLPKLDDYLREGKTWAALCQGRDGLLCLIPPGIDWLNLAVFREEVACFHAALDDDPLAAKLCDAGETLQRSIWRCLELPEFVFESAPTTRLRPDQLAPLLEPFRLARSNVWDPGPAEAAAWPRPAGWGWAWPSDPSAARPGDVQCSFCPRKSCRCIDLRTPQVPRVSDDMSKGPGIRSLGTHYKHQILGELAGELVPPGSRPGDWTLPLRRPDLGGGADALPVAEIYPRRMGNWVRKVRHCGTNPSAEFRVMKISGRWRQMLVMLRDVADGEEITVRYGAGFAGDLPYGAVEGLH